MQRYWLLTWTTYGTWLPGDDRGFVGSVRLADGVRDQANGVQTEPHYGSSSLKSFSAGLLKHAPVRLNLSQAESLLEQFQETARYRRWLLVATAVMSNHAHLVVGVNDDPEPSSLLRDFKSYGSRALNHSSRDSSKQRWWTEHGSTRKLADEAALSFAIEYVRQQPSSLVVWTDNEWISAHLSNRIVTSRE